MAIIPEEIYKRRHFGTPQAVSLIVTNYIVVVIAVQIFAMSNPISWFFWAVIGLLAVYNFYQIRKNREDFDRKNLIVYAVSVILLLAVFFLLRLKANQ